MSSLITLRGGVEPSPPFEVLGAKADSRNSPHGVYLQGGVINSFTELSTDYTCLDVDKEPIQAINNQQLPVAVNPIGGSFHIELPIQQDKLTNPSSILVQLHIAVHKHDANGSSIPVVKTDGILPTNGFYPIRNINAKINQHYVNGDIQAKSSDNSLFRNMDILSEYSADFTFGNVKNIYNKYNNFHGIHQTLAESKAGKFRAYTLDKGVVTGTVEMPKEKECLDFKTAFHHFQQKNVQKMLNGGFIVKLELDFGFLNKTRLTPFVIESAILELAFQRPLAVLARENGCKVSTIDSVHFMIKNVYIQHQSVVPSEKLWTGLVKLSEVSSENKDKTLILPSWPVQQKIHFDSVSIPKGSSSIMSHIRGREIPERLFLFFRRVSNVCKTESNDLYLDFPEIKTIKITSNSLSAHFINQTLTSPFVSNVNGISDAASYSGKNEFEQSLIDIHINQLTLDNLKANANRPILEDKILSFTPYFALHGHFIGGVNLVTAITSEPNMQSPVNEGNLTVEVTFSTQLTEEYIFHLLGLSNAVQILNIDKSFDTSRLIRGTAAPDALEMIKNISHAK